MFNEASQTAPASEVVSEEVTYATVDGTAVTGYLSRPAGAEGSIPGLVAVTRDLFKSVQKGDLAGSLGG